VLYQCSGEIHTDTIVCSLKVSTKRLAMQRYNGQFVKFNTQRSRLT